MRFHSRLVAGVVAVMLGFLVGRPAEAGRRELCVPCGNVQSLVTPSGAPNVVQATTEAMTLYVNGEFGSDSNACTSSGAGACATICGAVSKVPKNVRHPVTIDAENRSDAGTIEYVGCHVSDFQFSPADPAAGAYLDLRGAFINAPVDAGTATGTATAGSAGSNTTATWGTLTDSNQAWTTNALAGWEIETLTGTGAGQSRFISSNTATVITIEGVWTAPANGTTYAIRTHGSVLNSGVSQSAMSGVAASAGAALIVSNNHTSRIAGSTGGQLSIRKMKIAPASGTGILVLDSSLYLSDVAVETVSSSGAINGQGRASSMVLSAVRLATATGSALTWSGSNTSTPGGALNLNNVQMISSGAATVLFSNGAAGLTASGLGLTIGASGGFALLGTAAGNGMSNTQVTGLRGTCTSGGSTRGLYFTSAVGTGSGYTVAGFGNGGVVLTNCPQGLVMDGPSLAYFTAAPTFTGPGSGTAINVSRGGRVIFAADPTISSYATELQVDGITRTVAQFSAMSPKLFSTESTYGSYISGTAGTSGGFVEGGVLHHQGLDAGFVAANSMTSRTGIVLNTAGGGSKPSCDATIRGMLWYVQGGGGAADTYELCAKAAADSYAWRSLVTVP